MKRIEQILVVEGKNDTRRLKRYFDVDTVETGGAGMTASFLDYLEALSKERELILFLDPDTPGEQIRKRINERIPGLKNAFVLKKQARTSKKVGVEHAEKEVLEKALSSFLTYGEEFSSLNYEDFLDLGLSGRADSKERRERLARALPVGECNGKTLYKRLNMLHIRKEELEDILWAKE